MTLVYVSLALVFLGLAAVIFLVNRRDPLPTGNVFAGLALFGGLAQAGCAVASFVVS